jgi:V/A-type H+-transporting ATPase subunit F
MRVFVLGHAESVLGFSLAGVAGMPVDTLEEINGGLDEALRSSDVGIVLVTQDVAAKVRVRMDQLKLRSTVPLFVEIPSPAGVAEDQPSLGDVVLRAIGVKL